MQAVVPRSQKWEDSAPEHGLTQSSSDHPWQVSAKIFAACCHLLLIAHVWMAWRAKVPGVVAAGGAMLFDARTWHTALPNVNGVDRRTLVSRKRMRMVSIVLSQRTCFTLPRSLSLTTAASDNQVHPILDEAAGRGREQRGGPRRSREAQLPDSQAAAWA